MDNLWYEDARGERHEIVMVEYRSRRPFSVTTLIHWDHSQKPWFKPGDKPNGTCPQHWDFEWCHADGCLYYHNSGGGGDFHFVRGPGRDGEVHQRLCGQRYFR